MSTTTAPIETITLSDFGSANTTDGRPDANTVAFIRTVPTDAWAHRLVSAPYAHPQMADVVRFAVMLTDDGGYDHLLGRVIQCGPQTWGAFNADATHRFGSFRTADMAGKYVASVVEW